MAQFIANVEEKILVDKLRESLVDIADWQDLKMDAFILRWLKSKDMNLDKTKKALLEHYKFRQDLGLDTILVDYKQDPDLENLVKLSKYDLAGHCKEGCPILIGEVPAKMNPGKILKKHGKVKIIRFGEYHLEKVTEMVRDAHTEQKPVQQVVGIFDCKNFTLKQLTSPGAIELGLEQFLRFYPQFPDGLKLGVIVNAPRAAKIAYRIGKPFINDKDLKKIKIFPKCNAKVTKFLLQYIDIDELPERFGGNKKVGGSADPNTLKDEEEMSGNPEDLEEADMVEVKVASGKKLKLEYQVDQPKTQICWSFQTDDREIGFEVYRGEKEEIIVPYEKFESLSLQNNSIVCEKPGQYTLCFNNKENRFRSVALSYIVSVFPPGGDDEDE